VLGVIGGSGFYDFPDLKLLEAKAVTTPFGDPSAPIMVGTLKGKSIAFLTRHGHEHSIAPHCVNYRANIWALHALGVTSIIAVNAVGGISQVQEPGVISLPDQIIDYTYGRHHTFYDNPQAGLQHIDFSYPYSDTLRLPLLASAKKLGIPLVDRAIHGVTQGPRLETAAEIQRMAKDGVDIVGMTGMPEAALAREISLDYICVSLVVNRAAGLAQELITIESMQEVMKSGIGEIQLLISTYLESQ